jgi:hypothetical protein
MLEEEFWIDPKLQEFLRQSTDQTGFVLEEPMLCAREEGELFEKTVREDIARIVAYMRANPGDRTPGFSELPRFGFVSYISLVEIETRPHVLHMIWRAKFQGLLTAGVTAYPFSPKRIWSVGTRVVRSAPTN